MKKCPTCGKQYEGDKSLCTIDGAVLENVGDQLIGQTLAGKYRIEEPLNEGGMGAVYRATHVLMEKTVAIKVLHPALAADPKIVARFTREAKAASRISHPHALSVTDFGESEGGVVFLVMEYLRGRTLKEIIRNEGPMPVARVAEILRQVCGALEAAHSEGVIHRDLKSNNIMLEEVGQGQDWAKVLDFGIAKIQESTGDPDSELTAPNLIVGTPQYMSPEQCSQSADIDARSDIYSLGVVTYEMLTGRLPFTGESPTAIMLNHLQEAPPSVLEERKDVPAGVAQVVARALAKRPEDRYQSAGQLTEAFTLAAIDPASEVAAESAANDLRTAGQAPALGSVMTGLDAPPPGTASDALDEVTVVTTGAPRFRSAHDGRDTHHQPPPPASSFNPWRVAVPALVVLVMVFGLLYAYGPNAGEATNEEGRAPLTSDPNGRPVQAIKPPSGDSEKGIAPSTIGVTAGGPTAAVSPSATVSNVNPNENFETIGLPTPTPVENPTVISSDSSQPNDSKDTKDAEDEPPPPIPSPSKKNANQQPTPPPVKANPDAIKEQPEVKPAATPAPKPETPAATPKPAPPAQNPPPVSSSQ